MYKLIGITAAIIGIIAFIPILINTTVHKSTHSLHYGWLALKLFASLLWLFYGISNKLTPNIISSVAALLFLVYLFGFKYYVESNNLAKHQNCKEEDPAATAVRNIDII